MRRILLALSLVVAAAIAGAPAAHSTEGPASFSAEVFATPSYHVLEVPKVEEGGEGFSWAYINQSPESWGRSLVVWPGSLGEIVLRSSMPQHGPLAGHGWRAAPGAWRSYPPDGEGAGEVDFGDPARLPLGTTVETPGGRLRVLAITGRAVADEGVGQFALGDFTTDTVPLTIGSAESFAQARRQGDAALSTGWAVLHDIRVGDITIDELRSDVSARATPGSSTSTWTLTVTGVAVRGQRLAWTEGGISVAPGSDELLQRLNDEFAKGAESLRSEVRLVPGRTWNDDAGAHARSGFLQVGHRPLIAENNPGQKLGYSLSVASARALYQAVDAGSEPVLSSPGESAAQAPASTSSAVGQDAATPAIEHRAPASVTIDQSIVGTAVPFRPTRGDNPSEAVVGADLGGAPEEVAARPMPDRNQPVKDSRAPVAHIGDQAAKGIRGGMALLALGGATGTLAALRAARRQLALVGSQREGR